MYYPNLSSPAVWGMNYLNSNIRKKRRIQAKQGKLLTKQGRKRKV
jgi:hypothetical protein